MIGALLRQNVSYSGRTETDFSGVNFHVGRHTLPGAARRKKEREEQEEAARVEAEERAANEPKGKKGAKAAAVVAAKGQAAGEDQGIEEREGGNIESWSSAIAEVKHGMREHVTFQSPTEDPYCNRICFVVKRFRHVLKLGCPTRAKERALPRLLRGRRRHCLLRPRIFFLLAGGSDPEFRRPAPTLRGRRGSFCRHTHKRRKGCYGCLVVPSKRRPGCSHLQSLKKGPPFCNFAFRLI